MDQKQKKTAMIVGAAAGIGLLAYLYKTRQANAAEAVPLPPVPAPSPSPSPPSPSPAPSPGPGPAIYNPSGAKQPRRAHDLAIAFGNSIDPTTGDTYPTIEAFGAVPSNRYAITQFQDAAGLMADGIVGPLTHQAFDYWYVHTG